MRRPSNEALQQTRSALTTVAAALAAERQCSANVLDAGGAGTAGLVGRRGFSPHRPRVSAV
jgi:hypothetical protein